MTKGEQLFHDIAASIPDAKEGKMFGALCVKAPNGKAGLMFWKGYMIFKLDGKVAEEALALKNAKTFEPADGRPMNGWIQLSEDHAAKWKKYAQVAMENVKKIEVKPKATRAKK